MHKDGPEESRHRSRRRSLDSPKTLRGGTGKPGPWPVCMRVAGKDAEDITEKSGGPVRPADGVMVCRASYTVGDGAVLARSERGPSFCKEGPCRSSEATRSNHTFHSFIGSERKKEKRGRKNLCSAKGRRRFKA